MKPKGEILMNKLSVDRIEENFLVCIDEEGNSVVIPVAQAEMAKPGDIISEQDGKYIVNHEETEKKRREIIDLQNSLWE